MRDIIFFLYQIKENTNMDKIETSNICFWGGTALQAFLVLMGAWLIFGNHTDKKNDVVGVQSQLKGFGLLLFVPILSQLVTYICDYVKKQGNPFRNR